MLLEVKWKSVKKEDIQKAERTLSMKETKKKILFVPDKKGMRTQVTVMDVTDLLV